VIQDTLDIGKEIKSHVYHSIGSRELGEKQQIVKDCLLSNPDGLTDKAIAVETGLSLSCVCGRRNELMHMGIVEAYTIYTYMDEDGKGVPNVVWGINERLEVNK
jgi:hypothetical protein